LDNGAQTGLIPGELFTDPNPDIPSNLSDGGDPSGFGGEFFQRRTPHMRKIRERNISRALVLATHTVIETAHFKSFLAFVEHDILQSKFHRAPNRPAKNLFE